MSEPEPDLALVRNRPDDYIGGHPRPADVLLLIEVSDSSVLYDQTIKLSLYAESGIANYWIFNLLDAVLESYSDPYRSAQGNWAYRTKQIYLSTEPAFIPNLPEQPSLSLAKAFPPSR